MVTAAMHTACIKQKQSGKARTKPSGVFMAVCSFLRMSLIGFVRPLPSLEVNCAILLVLMLPGAFFPM